MGDLGGCSAGRAVVSGSGSAGCAVRRDRGTIEPGKAADFVATAANPLDDITALRQVSVTVKNGEVVG
jgi:imidazolonepropionase-like amidohydrolase